MKRWYFFLAALIIIMLAGIALLFFNGPGSTARLADGTELRLLGVSMGTNQFSTDTRVYALARKVLPVKWQKWIPKPLNATCGLTNGITIWLQLWDPVRHPNVVQNWFRSEAVNDAGEIHSNTGHVGMSWGNNEAYAYILLNFPRRQRSFVLRLYDTNNQLAATLLIPSPYQGPFPTWKAEPLPQTRTNGDLVVTLESMKNLGLDPKFLKRINFNYTYQWKGAPSTLWRSSGCILHDATGNTLGGGFVGMCESEPVWRIQQTFSRTTEAPYAPDERFLMPNLPVLAPGTYTNLNILTNLQGMDFCIFLWTGPALLTFSNDVVISAAPPEKRGASWTQLWWRYEGNAFMTAINFEHPSMLVAQHIVPDVQVRFVFRGESQKVMEWNMPETPYFMTPLAYRFPEIRAMGPIRIEREFGYMVQQPQIPVESRSISYEITAELPRVIDFYIQPPRASAVQR
jgi:hypothetical protein